MKRTLTLLLLCSAVFVAGCGYGEVSPTAYELSMSLYSVSNRKLGDRLPVVDKRIALARSEGEISVREAEWLNEIVELAEEQEWKKAMKQARRMMEDQVSN